MDIFILGCDFIIPSVMVILGLYYRNNFPKKINDISGYRTKRSMQNDITWAAAQKYFSDACIRLGILACAISALLTVVCYKYLKMDLDTLTPILLVVQFGCFFATYIVVERLLKK